MGSIEKGFLPSELEGDNGGLSNDPEINLEQMAENGITLIDFSHPPEGIVLLSEPFPADSLWRNLSRPPRK